MIAYILYCLINDASPWFLMICKDSGKAAILILLYEGCVFVSMLDNLESSCPC